MLVIELGKNGDDELKMEMNKSAEIRIRSGNRCEEIVDGYIKKVRCRNTPRQRFTWVPASMFAGSPSGSGKRGKHPKKKARGKPSSGKRRKARARPSPKLNYESSTDSSTSTEAMLAYIDTICKANLEVDECKKYYEIYEEAPAYKTSGKGGSRAGNTVSVTGEVEIRGTLRRKPGLYAGKEESEGSCHCPTECVKNHRNGFCYYRLSEDGNLEPLVKKCNCNRDKNLCDLTNALDKLLCELTFKNDYDYFSKFLDERV